MFYIQNKEKNKIVVVHKDRNTLVNNLRVMPDYTEADIKETKPNEQIVDFKLVTIEEAEKLQEAKERAELDSLLCTKRAFALILKKKKGITYQQLKDLIAASDDAQLEWELCTVLKRDNPLIDLMGARLGVTSQDIDNIFREANNIL